jgi:hypothetical protein
MAVGYGLDDRGFEFQQGLGIFSSPPYPDRNWGPTSLLYYRYQWLFIWG